jgi:RNA polymerase sigma-70 factor (ECF subfamily)
MALSWRHLSHMARIGAESASSQGSTSDEALAERVRTSGDQVAFALLVTRYRVRLVALARRMLTASGSDEAEDVAQEAFLAAYDKRTSFRRGESYRPWLYRIAVNKCLDRLRSHSRRPSPVAWDSVPEGSATDADPVDVLLADEGEHCLASAVAALPPKLRAVFLLRHLDDLSYDEIATATGVPAATVKTHLFRARAQLRAALAEYLAP